MAEATIVLQGRQRVNYVALSCCSLLLLCCSLLLRNQFIPKVKVLKGALTRANRHQNTR
jgi:hypothetical protein